jgi:hypothetical protein
LVSIGLSPLSLHPAHCAVVRHACMLITLVARLPTTWRSCVALHLCLHPTSACSLYARRPSGCVILVCDFLLICYLALVI